MKYAIISDIHANLDALRVVLDDADEQGVDRIVCLGDIVGYGPQPAEAVKLVRSRAAAVVAGNHDDAVSGRADESNFIDFAADAVKRHREALGEEELEWLRSLPYICELPGNALAAHGDVADARRFQYILGVEAAAANFKATGAQLLFVGHTHLPCLFLTGGSGNVYMTPPQDFVVEEGKRYIVNVGTVGYPRDTTGPVYSTYVIYDTEEKSVVFRQLPFSMSSVMQHGTTVPAPAGKPAKHHRLFAAVAAAVLCALAVAIAAFAFLGRAPDAAVDGFGTMRVVATKTLDIYDGQKKVRANLFLSDDSSPAVVRVVFHDSKGRDIQGPVFDVKRSSTKALNLHKRADKVSVSVIQPEGVDAPVIERFDPSVSVE